VYPKQRKSSVLVSNVFSRHDGVRWLRLYERPGVMVETAHLNRKGDHRGLYQFLRSKHSHRDLLYDVELGITNLGPKLPKMV
jgi:hypothetical protein